jgi:hypothetical protein
LSTDPFERRLKSVTASEDVGARQAHKRQSRTLGTTSDTAAHSGPCCEVKLND